MNKFIAVLLFAASAAGADPPAGLVRLRVAEGRLALAENRWSVPGGPEARVWWREAGGSGWLKVGGFQTGPLEGRAAAAGEWAWGPGTDLAEGSWGAAADLGPAAGWLVEAPGRLVLGGQLRWSADLGRVAGGFCRTFDTTGGPPADEVRVGAGWTPAPGPGAAELRLDPGTGGWKGSLRQAWVPRGGRLSLTAAAEGGPGPTAAEGTAEVAAGILRCSVGGRTGGFPDQAQAGLDFGALTAGPRWTSARGWGGRLEAGTTGGFPEVRGDLTFDAAGGAGSVRFSGATPAGRARLEIGGEGAVDGVWKARLSAGLDAGPLELGLVWTRTDGRLGWLVPGAGTLLTAQWRY